MRVLHSYRQGIMTRYAGPTEYRGSRIIASCQAGRVTVGWDHGLNTDENHEAAAAALVQRLGWGGEWRGAASPKLGVHMWVMVEETR